MKILITTDTYYPMINGVVSSTNNLYKELKKNGHDVRIMTLSDTKEKFEGDVYYLKSFKINVYPDARIKTPFHNNIIKDIIRWHPDIIHSQTEFSTMVVAKYIAKKLHITQIHTYHTMYEDYTNYILGGKIIRRNMVAKITKLLLNSFDAVIAPTHKTEKALIGYGVNKDIYVIPTGIDLSKYQKAVTENEKNKLLATLEISKDDYLIAYVGRIAEEKNIDDIIKLYPTIIEKIPNTKFLIVGGGPKLEDLKNHVSEMKLNKQIIFTGMISPEEVYKYYNIADVFVTASTSETQGLTYLEALSSGCPVVCKWDQCVDGVVIQGKNGFAYKKDWEFSEYVSDILLNKDLRDKMSKAAKLNSNEYSIELFGSRVMDTYNKVTDFSTMVHSKDKTYRV